jgi:ribosomal protein S6--L-glutamate ligase
MGLEVAGVDMLEGNDGPKILEINSSPGLEGIERASGIDVAGAIIEEAERYAERRRRRRPGRNGSRDAVIEDERRPRRLRSKETLPPPRPPRRR